LEGGWFANRPYILDPFYRNVGIPWTLSACSEPKGAIRWKSHISYAK
jgi:hypothetical protein